jgi:GNAT superfamily N-acetyltransferase
MAAIKNFETDGLFFKENMSFIERYYYEHFYLVKIYESLINREFKVIDAFSVIDGDSLILFLSTENSIAIYGNNFNDKMIDLLYDRAIYNRKYSNFRFLGNKDILIRLFNRFRIDFSIEKDRIIYETSNTIPFTKKHLGKTLKSGTDEFDQLVQLSYDYSIAEWGEREAKGIDYVKRVVRNAINEGALVQYDTSFGIACIAQVLNLENQMPVIGSLYTPPEKRGKGYATMLVHAVTKKLLEGGFVKCGIISDATNPITNKLFVNVGYKPIYYHLSLFCPEFKSTVNQANGIS